MSKYLLRLSWPAAPLWENRNAHWRDKSDAKAAAKREAWALSLQQKLPKSKDARLHFSYYQPNRIKRDCSNMPATQKAAIDGIALAMGVDDQFFEVTHDPKFAGFTKGGAVLVEVTPVTVEIEHRGAVS